MTRPALLVLAMASLAAAQGTEELARSFLESERAAFALLEADRLAEAVVAFEKQIAVFPENPRPYYNIACCYARLGEAERAATWLRTAVLKGWRDLEHTLADGDFQGARGQPAFEAALASLRSARETDPDPLPRDLDFASAPAASSAAVLLRALLLEELAIAQIEPLLEEDQVRRRLFPHYDRKSAALGRYLAENGDARDADLAAYERVRTALLYLGRAREKEQALMQAAAEAAVRRAEEFVRGWAYSPYLGDVYSLRAKALGEAGLADDTQALAFWQAIVADFPDCESASSAQAETCRLLARLGRRDELRLAWATLRTRWGGWERMDLEARRHLLEARLFAEGMEMLPGVEGAAEAKVVLIHFVAETDAAFQVRVDAARAQAEAHAAQGLLVVLARIGGGAPERLGPAVVAVGIPPEAAAERGILVAPTTVLLRGREVLALDPTDADLARLLP
ncbi:MAG: TPR end-of-group domain-containing protein [Planctomycetaceae bacterium]